MDQVQDLLANLVGDACAKKLLTSFQVEDIRCHKLLISKLLGLGIVVGSSILKVPQIVKILRSRSARGISFSSYLLETIACTIGFAYNYRRDSPFSTYGEGAFILIQNLFVLLLMLFYNRRLLSIFLLMGLYSAGCYALAEPGLVTSQLLLKLQWSNLFIGIASKLPQIWGIYKLKSTGQLSLVTTFLQFAGSAARVFTTLQEVSDVSILTGFVVMTALNGIVLTQFLMYWQSDALGFSLPFFLAFKLPTSEIELFQEICQEGKEAIKERTIIAFNDTVLLSYLPKKAVMKVERSTRRINRRIKKVSRHFDIHKGVFDP